jgi:hypothetical protein
VIVSTSAVSDTIDAATVDRIISAALGSPVIDRGTVSSAIVRSNSTVPNDSAMPATAHANGISHRLVRSRWLSRKVRRPTLDQPAAAIRS